MCTYLTFDYPSIGSNENVVYTISLDKHAPKSKRKSPRKKKSSCLINDKKKF